MAAAPSPQSRLLGSDQVRSGDADRRCSRRCAGGDRGAQSCDELQLRSAGCEFGADVDARVLAQSAVWGSEEERIAASLIAERGMCARTQGFSSRRNSRTSATGQLSPKWPSKARISNRQWARLGTGYVSRRSLGGDADRDGPV